MIKSQFRNLIVGTGLALLLGIAGAQALTDDAPRGTVSAEFLGVVSPTEAIPEVLVLATRLPETIRLAAGAAASVAVR